MLHKHKPIFEVKLHLLMTIVRYYSIPQLTRSQNVAA